MGVFQIESRAQMASLRRTRPETLDDLTIQVAIVRPGPDRRRRGQPLHRPQAAPARGPVASRSPTTTRRSSPCCRTRSARSSSRTRCIEVAMAFAGFSPGRGGGAAAGDEPQALGGGDRGLPRALRRGRGARRTAPTRRPAERVCTMVAGFSGFGFPKAHGAAFGLLAYQSTWLRVHYSPEFLCALLNEQPMGFYPPTRWSTRPSGAGIEVLRARRQRTSARGVHASERRGRPRCGIGLGYVLGVRADEVAALVAAREAGGPFRSLGDLASRAGAGRPALELLAWSGACDALLGAAPAGAAHGAVAARASRRRRTRMRATARSSRCRSSCRTRRALKPLERVGGDGRRLRDDRPDRRRAPAGAAARRAAGRGTVVERRPRARCRTARGCGSAAWSSPASGRGPPRASSSCCSRTSTGRSTSIVPPPVYERDRLAVRAEPLVLAEGRLEKHAVGGRGDQRRRATRSRRCDAPGRARPRRHARLAADLAERARASEARGRGAARDRRLPRPSRRRS